MNSRPVYCLSTVADLLATDSDGVVNLIDDGKLLFAWNISTPQARCREIRILAEAVEAYRQNRPCKVKTLSEAVAMVLGKPTVTRGLNLIRRSTLQRRLGVSGGHIANLIKAGEIHAAPLRVGKNESPWLMHDSVSQWLNRRALGRIAFKGRIAL